MAELARNPGMMRRAQDEVRSCVGTRGKIEHGDLEKLQYLKAVIKETLRLHCPAPLLLPRVAGKHCRVAGYDIPPGTRVLVNAWGICRDPKTWKDPEEFVPERFLGSSLDFRGHDLEFIPFGSGRRICPGMNFGVASIELALANLLYRFDWEIPGGMKPEDMDMEEVPGLVIHKKTPLRLIAVEHKM